MMKNLRVKV